MRRISWTALDDDLWDGLSQAAPTVDSEHPENVSALSATIDNDIEPNNHDAERAEPLAVEIRFSLRAAAAVIDAVVGGA
jgi:hypothetical protein